MTSNLPPDPSRKREIVLPDSGGWISGPMDDTPYFVADPKNDTRPEFNPQYFVAAAIRMLGEHGVHAQMGDSMVYPAEIAAADFLRAIGVRPASIPR